MGISPGTLASAFLSRSLPSPGLSSQWFFFRPVRGQSPLGRKVLYRKSMCFQTKEGAQLLSVHTFPGFTGLPEGATAGSTLPEPSSPPLLSCLLKKQKKKKKKFVANMYTCVCVCVCVYTYINFSVQSFVTVLPNFSLRAPVYCPGLLPASSSRVGEAPFTASRKLGCNPDPAPLSFTVLPNLFTGDNDPCLAGLL